MLGPLSMAPSRAFQNYESIWLFLAFLHPLFKHIAKQLAALIVALGQRTALPWPA
jgi:hypothetical protein